VGKGEKQDQNVACEIPNAQPGSEQVHQLRAQTSYEISTSLRDGNLLARNFESNEELV
jgi:hypothetical protein